MRYFLSLILVTLSCSIANSQGNNPVGDWSIVANGSSLTLSISQQGDQYVGYLFASGMCTQKIDKIDWDSETGRFEFRRAVDGMTQWYRATIGDGVITGRFSHTNVSKGAQPDHQVAYQYNVTGVKREAFPDTPIVFDILANRSRGRLRIDRTAEGQLVGRLKYYALGNALWEQPEEEITVHEWDGVTIRFTRGTQVYNGSVEGETVKGTFTSGSSTHSWTGKQAEYLTYGLVGKTPEQRAEWQARTRRILHRLMMDGNPMPLTTSVEILQQNVDPIPGTPHPSRDDNPGNYPQNYKLSEFRLTATVPTWTGETATRVITGYISKPTVPPPGGLDKYPVVLALNGHGGSAFRVMSQSDNLFSYGDMYGRRGYIVVAVNISHRPTADLIAFGSTADLSTRFGYSDTSKGEGDAPWHGNGAHPSIKPPRPAGYTAQQWALMTNWEEDGERAWDVMRALDYALSLPEADPLRVVVTGLSMGAEVAAYVGALDPRVSVTIPAGYSPDLNVLRYKEQGGHCWNWWKDDITKYINQSDVFALSGGRALVVTTGQQDQIFSLFPQSTGILPPIAVGAAPFAADQQVMRRARVAFNGSPLFHYLHAGGHVYSTGVTNGGIRYTTIPSPAPLAWQAQVITTTNGQNLFEYVRAFLGF